MQIDVRGLHKVFAGHAALRDVSVTVRTGELVALLGPSGSGKTTLLRVIAGLEAPDRGAVFFDGVDGTAESATARRVGFVFQHYALFRHMTVFENVAFGLRVRSRATRPPAEEIRRRVDELLTLVQLDYLGSRYPSQLSGGQRQRVALARALAVEPSGLLRDEPCGALDARVRQELRRWLRRLHGQIHLTSVFVTHDQEEALELADRVVVMNEGRVEQDGTPEAVVEQPASPFVMTFVGNVNIFHGRVQRESGLLRDLAAGARTESHADRHAAVGYCRPHELEISRVERGEGLWATVSDIRTTGALAKVELSDSTGGVIQVELGREPFAHLGAAVGERLYVRPRRLRRFSTN